MCRRAIPWPHLGSFSRPQHTADITKHRTRQGQLSPYAIRDVCSNWIGGLQRIPDEKINSDVQAGPHGFVDSLGFRSTFFNGRFGKRRTRDK